jgi:hypothetical protein
VTYNYDAIGAISAMKAVRVERVRLEIIECAALDGDGRLRVAPAAFWAETTSDERAVFGHRHAAYVLPTMELVQRLHELIDGRKAIEIGAGNGVLAEALEIPATDSRQQERPKYRKILADLGQPPVRYGKNIIHLDARRAIQRYKPEVVIASWVTHRYDRNRHWAGGNEVGVVEEDILNHAEYIFIGNEHAHHGKVIWDYPHEIEYPDYVYSRATPSRALGHRDFIATWRKDDQA